ncbi:MAG TPA: D-aminoacyl-tRNA deacylase [Methanomassiliicoccales archaeon]|jgi:D-aminoacyl-tRNA deacylase|nr:D-aminoacyl-tRNA deacylase [Methanomassiliicoccales archaeon]HRR66465.1 D-aminoacyl-tRNA deacylase [Methanomassiliicoccales archaeon]HRU11492.1 D-aminoacyl-tRNA deacylase [Methanomassiliicoccales archaeon]
MRLLVASAPDPASLNIRDRLLEMGEWQECGTFRGQRCYRLRDMLMVSFDDLHLHLDLVDRLVGEALEVEIGEVVFLSKHRAASGRPTLTVHPIGNFGRAEYGGRDGTLVPASPAFMSGLLRALSVSAKGLPFEVSYEVTHHGPYLEMPTTFVEIGSDEGGWGNQEAGKAVTRALLGWVPADGPTVVGVGGGHYAPRFTEVTLAKRVRFGHMVAKHVLDGKGDNEVLEIVGKAAGASGTSAVYIHRKSFSRPEARRLGELFEGAGLKVLEGADLQDL